MTDKNNNNDLLENDSAQAQVTDTESTEKVPFADYGESEDFILSDEDELETEVDTDAIKIEVNEELAQRLIDTANAVLEGEHIVANPGSIFGQLAKPELTIPKEIFLLPVKERPFFPGQQLPVLLNKDSWGETYDAIKAGKCKYIGIIFVNTEDHDKAEPSDFCKMGTLVKIHDPKVKEDYIQLIAEGVKRFDIENWVSGKAPYRAQVNYPKDIIDGSEQEFKAYGLAIMNAFRELLPLNPLYSEELKYFLNRYSASEPSQLADFAAGLTTAENDKLQDVLETLNLAERMEKVLALFKQEIEVTKIQFNIRERVEEKLSDHQREFFLRQQLNEIQKELGMVKDDQTLDTDRFRERIEKLTLSKEATKKAEEELSKLSMLDPQSPEYNVARNWLDWLTQLPWGKYSEDLLDLKRAKKVLDKGHDGLEDVKDRILEFLAVGSLKGEVSGSIICLVGPPGVGKTSIGRSIAESLGRKFYRFSVGGMRDEAEIKGHRRTYIGAMPGKFMQALKDCETANPVIMLDEIDKIGASFQGDPASALLEVLDPEQNHEFMDHFMDIRFDLSKALFVCTANTLDTIPGPLLDRMEVIRLSGYITEEKVQIAKHHLWPSLLKESGLTKEQVQITPAAIRHVIEGYARESGVRNLKKQLAKLVRKLAIKFVTTDLESTKIHVNELEEMLGQPRFTPEKTNQQIGTVTGLAWTSMGGATLTIEAGRVHTLNRGFKLSGQLGDVMQESAGIAYSFISSNLEKYKADPEFFDKAFVHLHVPDGATPKDGPSAGVTMATALLSLARDEAIKTPLAMTGELSLTGLVLPVGGIREKVIAAKRIGIKELILPEDNRKDFQELPDYLQEGITVHFAKHFDDVARLTFNIRSKSLALKTFLSQKAAAEDISTQH
ncbi:endopeptidase La [Thiomicrorhabdus lithotrophica]|uniref:Lon protease n=1 Tax=Thiomicrorhabdus lithotrophica TaxID=2949997 RepID=A0ABY8C7K6_9GAMM|nr:endopeptidase La [Thiomicrorhabdus lithotrophica]WEJ61945.1 endopeptidase La [Thiomicrorhabdus lithotrophica]